MTTPSAGVPAWLIAIFERKTASGERAYTSEAVEDYLAAALLELGFDAEDLTPPVEKLLGDFALRAGIDPEASEEHSKQQLRDYFTAHPLDPKLLADIDQAFREQAASGPINPGKIFAKYVGARANTFQPREAPREGAVRGGPLGFFLAKKKLGD